MINLENVRTVCNAYLSGYSGALCHAVTGNAKAVPTYNPRERRLSICNAALKDGAIGRVCSRFYSGLPLAAGKTKCPFGVTLLYQRTTVSGRPVCLYQQVQCLPDKEPAKELPRIPKKAAMEALMESTRQSDERKAQEKFDDGRDLLATLHTGRVAESIRALSHHLLTPLQGAIADAELLKDGQRGGTDLPGRLGRNLAAVDDSAKQIQILLSDAIEFSPKKLRKAPTVAMMQELVESLEPQARQRGIQIDHRPSTHARNIEAIPDQLRVVFSNLLQNAIKYSFNDRMVRITYRAEGEHLVIQFRNEGCGISRDEIEDNKIFELGYRGRDSGDRGRTGTGTGLYIANQIAEAHDALLRVFSTTAATASVPAFQAHQNRIELVWPVYSRRKS